MFISYPEHSVHSLPQALGRRPWDAMHRLCFLLLIVVGFSSLEYCRGAILDQSQGLLSFGQHIKCTYTYEVAVHTARGVHSTASDGYQVHALVSLTL